MKNLAIVIVPQPAPPPPISNCDYQVEVLNDGIPGNTYLCLTTQQYEERIADWKVKQAKGEPRFDLAVNVILFLILTIFFALWFFEKKTKS